MELEEPKPTGYVAEKPGKVVAFIVVFAFLLSIFSMVRFQSNRLSEDINVLLDNGGIGHERYYFRANFH